MRNAVYDAQRLRASGARTDANSAQCPFARCHPKPKCYNRAK